MENEIENLEKQGVVVSPDKRKKTSEEFLPT